MASFYPLKLSLANKTTGVPITDYLQLNLRWSVDSYATSIHPQVGSGDGGIYTFGSVGSPVYAGDYKLYDDTTELTAFGVIRVGEPDAVLTSGNQASIAGNKGFTGVVTLADAIIGDTTVTGDMVFVTGKSLTVDKTPVGPNEVLRLEDLQDYATLDGNQEITGDNLFSGVVTFDQTPVCATADGTEGASYLINQGALQDAIDAITVVPFQESLNDLRIIPAGVQETNKVYTTITGGQGIAASFATTNWRFVLKIEGTGTAANYLTLVDEFVNYVSYKGVYSGITLHFEDINYNSVTVLGNTTIENVILYRHDSNAGTPTFTNMVFKDVYFDCETSSVSFVNCQFKGNCAVKNSGGTISFDGNCIGGYVATNGAITARMFGIDGLTSTDF